MAQYTQTNNQLNQRNVSMSAVWGAMLSSIICPGNNVYRGRKTTIQQLQ